MFEYLQGFRETFSRPVRRIRFLGLFDTGMSWYIRSSSETDIEIVNSVPRFESAWMQRSKFPYTARSSAKVIRHAVSIDERRAKFRQDLVSGTKMSKAHKHHRHHRPGQHTAAERKPETPAAGGPVPQKREPDRFRRPSQVGAMGERMPSPQNSRMSVQDEQGRLMPRMSSANRLSSQDRGRLRSVSAGGSFDETSNADAGSIRSATTQISIMAPVVPPDDDNEKDEAAAQNIEEIWFPGCHADLGGGWPLSASEEFPLSHGPLVWMVREAQKAGLEFDQDKMRALRCCDTGFDMSMTDANAFGPSVPEVQITEPPDLFRSPHSEHNSSGWAPGWQPSPATQSPFHQTLHTAATRGVLHDCLEFNNGLGRSSVISWKMMEYMPFRRMDLKPDGSWQAISLPLPRGEVRDIPEDAWIHNSAIRRMEADENYRPGNLIIGGGGRGVRKAPKETGIGNWEILKDKGDPVSETYVRKGPTLDAQMK